MNDVIPERFNRIKMTTNELAESLGVSPTTITRAVKKLDAVLQPVEVNSQGGMLFDVGQATLIKQEIQKHHNLQNRQIDNVSTELEENQTIANALLILERRNVELRARAENAERLNAILMHTTRLYTITEIAKELGMTSGAKLNEVLEQKGVQYKVNGTWVPTCKYSDLGYFEIKQQVHDDTGYVYYDRKVTQEGRKFILELFNKELPA